MQTLSRCNAKLSITQPAKGTSGLVITDNIYNCNNNGGSHLGTQDLVKPVVVGGSDAVMSENSLSLDLCTKGSMLHTLRLHQVLFALNVVTPAPCVPLASTRSLSSCSHTLFRLLRQ